MFLGFTSSIVIILLMLNLPHGGGSLLFKHTVVPLPYLFGAAYLIAACYLFIVVKWNKDPNINVTNVMASFLICGLISIILTIPIYEIFYTIALHKKESGWWIFKKEEIVYRCGLFEWLCQKDGDAGLVEEPSKFFALMAIPRVRRSITTVQSGIF